MVDLNAYTSAILGSIWILEVKHITVYIWWCSQKNIVILDFPYIAQPYFRVHLKEEDLPARNEEITDIGC